MIEILFVAADLWMIFAGYYFGWKFIRKYHNYFFGIECMVVATSGTNFLLWSLFSGDPNSIMYGLAYFFDAFSRSFGITLVLILGLLMVTHRYKPSIWVEVGAFALATAGGLYLRQFHQDGVLYPGPATFFIVTNVIASCFVFYFAMRLWRAGSRGLAVWTTFITLAAMVIAVTYDFLPFPFDDASRTYFYTAALGTWGTQAFVYFLGYKALHNHNAKVDAIATEKMGAMS
ncbi:hypothetical protein [Arthrobacter sp. NtRootA1]|uniref:hypothetical protein n=1 Tax=Arthrobacter sp. NtRootA1 TaxID=2830983 RepID=UPI001CC4EE18|nr:hypothetical protein [Arthrobacter sp. NtRootA1]BCW06185.1 hypothetical protein NtRootA1_23230 [Arthrobacter sp. NtRootA1]